MTTARRYLVSLGTFDGVHRGHQKLMRWVIRKARALGLGTRVVFFASPPRFYFHPELSVPLLTRSSERRALLRRLGIDEVEVLRFGRRWAQMPHTRFFEEFVLGRWRAGGVLAGKDFAFGKDRLGDIAYLRAECRRRGLPMGVLPLVRVAGRKISSSDIRELLLAGEFERAQSLLGRRYCVSGRVVRGQGLGRRMGFPTANLSVPPNTLVPPGVHHVRVDWPGDGRPWEAVCNVGVRPTLGGRGKTRVVEIHIPRFRGNLYRHWLRVEFVRRLRAEKRFSGLKALARQIGRDIREIPQCPKW